MEALDAIFTRRSIRKFTADPVTAEEERILLKAAMCAPNTVNYRDWAFLVIREKETLCKLSEALSPNAPDLKNAPLSIVVCGDLTLTLRGLEEYWVQDCSLAAENLLIASNAIGLGAVWYGCYPQWNKVASVSKLLKLPRHIIPLCVLGVGHPAERKPDVSESRYELHKIHHERWENKEG